MLFNCAQFRLLFWLYNQAFCWRRAPIQVVSFEACYSCLLNLVLLNENRKLGKGDGIDSLGTLKSCIMRSVVQFSLSFSLFYQISSQTFYFVFVLKVLRLMELFCFDKKYTCWEGGSHYLWENTCSIVWEYFCSNVLWCVFGTIIYRFPWGNHVLPLQYNTVVINYDTMLSAQQGFLDFNYGIWTLVKYLFDVAGNSVCTWRRKKMLVMFLVGSSF